MRVFLVLKHSEFRSKHDELSLTTTSFGVAFFFTVSSTSDVETWQLLERDLGLGFLLFSLYLVFPWNIDRCHFGLNLGRRCFLTWQTMTPTHTGITVYTNTTTIACLTFSQFCKSYRSLINKCGLRTFNGKLSKHNPHVSNCNVMFSCLKKCNFSLIVMKVCCGRYPRAS